MEKNIKSYRHHYSPSIFTIGGKCYTSTEEGWLEVPEGTTLADLKSVWSDTSINTKKTGIGKVEEFQVASGRGTGKFYTVKNNNGNWSCTCSGFGYRKKCHHIEDTKKSFHSKT